jgi:ribonuclease E
MLVNLAEPLEGRIAVVRSGRLQEYYTERQTTREAAGNIYKGVVESVAPSLDAAFVNIGGTHSGFLQADNVMPPARKKRRFFPFPRKKKQEISAPASRNIRELLKPQDEVLVQVTKEAIGDKGPALTMHISIPGRYLVITPKQPLRGISRKIEDLSQRQHLRDMIDQIKLPEEIGAIIRTAGEGRTLRELERDAEYLLKMWRRVEESYSSSSAGKLLYAETDLAIRAARDIFTPDIDEIVIDSKEAFERTRDFFLTVMPRYSSRVRLHSGTAPLFEEYSIEQQIEGIYEREITLPGGGSIVIDETEALVAVDVNSGGFKKGDEKEVAFRVNLQAAEEIARQLRLRDLGGLIVIDFIETENTQDNLSTGFERFFGATEQKPTSAELADSALWKSRASGCVQVSNFYHLIDAPPAEAQESYQALKQFHSKRFVKSKAISPAAPSVQSSPCSTRKWQNTFKIICAAI